MANRHRIYCPTLPHMWDLLSTEWHKKWRWLHTNEDIEKQENKAPSDNTKNDMCNVLNIEKVLPVPMSCQLYGVHLADANAFENRAIVILVPCSPWFARDSTDMTPIKCVLYNVHVYTMTALRSWGCFHVWRPSSWLGTKTTHSTKHWQL